MQLDDSHDVLDALGDALLIVGCTREEQWQAVDANRAWERLAGRPRADCLRQPLDRIFHSELATEVIAACNRCIHSREPVDLQVQDPVATHSSLQQWTISPVSEPSSEAPRVVLQVRSAVQEAAAPPSTDRFRNILEHTSDFIAQYDTSGRYVFVNRALRELFGATEAEVLGKFGRAEIAVKEVVRTGKSKDEEHLLTLPNKVPEWHHIRMVPERDARGNVVSVIVTGRDITSLKLAEERLRQSEQHFRTLTEHSPDYILRYDRELRLLYANPTAQRYENASSLANCIRQKPGGDLAPIHLQFSEPKGPILAALRHTMDEEQPVELELEDGALHISFTFMPERDANGEVESVLAIGRDVTHLKMVEAELRLMNATLEERVAARTQELELANRDLKGFAYTVSHDLRAPLRAIFGFTKLIQEYEGATLSHDGRALLNRICAAASKLDRLINEILEYSRAGQATLTRRRIAFTELAHEVAADLLVQYPSATVHIGQLRSVSGDPTMLRQVLQNLIGNALKFSAHQPHPRIEVNCQHDNGETAFYVRDNGAGFDMRYAEKLGGLFQRLHSEREYPGSGVGLAIVQRLIERHGGRIWATSEVGAGATFFFTVPEPALDRDRTVEHRLSARES